MGDLKDEKGTTPVQGTEVDSSETSENQEGVVQSEETPVWAANLIESNNNVAESNNRLADALEAFKGFPAPGTEQKKAVKKAAPEFKPDATYVVAKGHEFNDVENFKVSYKAGDDVTSLGEKRIKAMLENGLVVEK